jgi:NAD(P)-dependent dehydrogenase (short-subunit alcohol dehydrogenase family)
MASTSWRLTLLAKRGPAELAAASLASLGGVDIVVSTSGGQTRRLGGALGLGDDGYLTDFESNLMAAVRLDRALVPGMIEQGSGAIVHVGSGAARNVRRHPMGYAAAKAALTAYSKGLAAELGPHGIRVNVVQPGMIRTERMDERLAELAAASGQDPEAALRTLLDSYDVPLGQVGTPDEVAAAIAFLGSAAATSLSMQSPPARPRLLSSSTARTRGPSNISPARPPRPPGHTRGHRRGHCLPAQPRRPLRQRAEHPFQRRHHLGTLTEMTDSSTSRKVIVVTGADGIHGLGDCVTARCAVWSPRYQP